MRTLYFFLIFNLFNCALYAQIEYNILYSPTQISEDFDFYITTLKAKHPNIYAYVSEADFDKKVKRVRSCLKDSMNLFEFGKALSSLNHCLDGHSGISINQLKKFYPKVEEQEKDIRQGFGFLFPDSITNESIYIYGKKVLAINGVSSDQIIKQCKRYTNQGDEINLQRCRLRFNFPIITYYLLDIKPPYRITYQDKKGKKTIKTETGLDGNLCTHFKGSCYDDPFHWKIYPNESIVYIEFNTCDRSEVGYPERFNTTLDSLFQEVENNKCKYLFIDITRNGGGSGYVPDALLSRFKHDSITLKATLIPAQLIDAKKDSVSALYYTRSPVTSGYDGTTFLITGPWTYSAAKTFCVQMKVADIATFVGERIGQSNEEYTESRHFKMPNTLLSFRCASMGYHWNVDLTPDISWSMNCHHEPFTVDELKKIIELYSNKKK